MAEKQLDYICTMIRYPIGQQNFLKIREEEKVYIDKTEHIYNLIKAGNYYFFSRPRRFGKSLLLSTIKELFTGTKKAFNGLWTADKWDWERKNPVIHLKISSIDYQRLGLHEALNREMDLLAKENGVLLEADNLKDKFRELIRKCAATARVVILVDEYDKPITDYLDDLPKTDENRAVFKEFYSVLKDADEYIQFLLITGVSKFAKVSLFSDLNNLNDITLHPRYAALVGITQQELETNFATEIAEMQQTVPTILQDLKEWYNGYSWDAEVRVYNPFSLLCFMDARVIRNFWFQTGTPTFLVKHMKKQKEFILDSNWVNEVALGNFDIEHLVSVPLLFQTGYLTIKKYNADSMAFQLGYPNKEVERSLKDALLSAYRDIYPGGDSVYLTYSLGEALKAKDFDKLMVTLDTLISTIPYDHWKAESESIFHIIVHLAFTLLGLDIRSEVQSSKGRCDVLLFTNEYIFALELKLDSTSQKALQQIVEKEYLKSFALDKREKIAIGINFSSKKRNVEGYEILE